MKRLLVFLSIVTITVVAGYLYSVDTKQSISIGSFTSVVLAPELPLPIIDPRKEGIRFVGDIMLARSVEKLMNKYGYMYPYLSLPAHESNLHLVGNFEGSIPKLHIPTESMQFSFSVQGVYAQGLKEYGFTHLGVANNHSYDHGTDDFYNTTAVLTEYALAPFGDQHSQASSTVRFLETQEADIALVGVFAVDTALSIQEIHDLLARATAKSDMQIVYIHWGTEYAPVHNTFQEKLAKALVDAGADAVVGHHPHVVQDIDVYKNAPIFYSLGNFIFDQYFSVEVQEGLMIDFVPTNKTLRFSLVPISNIGTRSQPRIMSAYERDVFLEDLAEKSPATLTQMIKTGVIELTR